MIASLSLCGGTLFGPGEVANPGSILEQVFNDSEPVLSPCLGGGFLWGAALSDKCNVALAGLRPLIVRYKELQAQLVSYKFVKCRFADKHKDQDVFSEKERGLFFEVAGIYSGPCGIQHISEILEAGCYFERSTKPKRGRMYESVLTPELFDRVVDEWTLSVAGRIKAVLDTLVEMRGKS
jgi:hypothetical protein